MRITIGSLDAEHKNSSATLAFDIESQRTVALEIGAEPFDIAIQHFDPARDIVYRVPEPLSPEELAEEVAIHVPAPFARTSQHRSIAGTIDGLVLLQHVSIPCPVVSPLAALKKVLLGIETVNSAILHAQNGGILFLRNAGNELYAGASAHSLTEFLDLEPDEREKIFPEFHASEIVFSGSDLDHFDPNLGPIVSARRIAIADFRSISEFAPEVEALLNENAHRYTLIMGTAGVYAEIFKEQS